MNGTTQNTRFTDCRARGTGDSPPVRDLTSRIRDQAQLGTGGRVTIGVCHLLHVAAGTANGSTEYDTAVAVVATRLTYLHPAKNIGRRLATILRPNSFGGGRCQYFKHGRFQNALRAFEYEHVVCVAPWLQHAGNCGLRKREPTA